MLSGERQALAHDLGQSESRLDVDGRIIRVALLINPLEFKYVDQDVSGVVSIAEIDEAIPAIFGAVKALVGITADAEPVKVTLEKYQLLSDSTLRLDITYEFAEAVTAVHVASSFGDLTRPGHRHAMTVYGAGQRHDVVLDASRKTFDVSLASGWRRSPVLWLIVVATLLLGVRVAVYLRARRGAPNPRGM